MNTNTDIIEVKNLKVRLGGTWIHNGLNLTVHRGEILGIVGSSGSGKTTLLREMLLLQLPDSGTIQVFDVELLSASPEKRLEIQKRWGVLFQQNALFSSLTVLENTIFPLKEHTELSDSLVQELALLKLMLVGLPTDSYLKYPSQLSGGMEKRAALARAIVLDPELLFLDEPTTGLDPDSATSLDDLILDLQSTMGLTIVMVTHDLDTLWHVTNRVAFLHEGKVLCVDKMSSLVHNQHPAIQTFFGGQRGRSAETTYGGEDDGNKR